MKLSELLSEATIIHQIQSTEKTDVINEMIDLFKDDPRVKDIEKVRETVLAREKIMSTGVGKNFAIPHGKTVATTDILCAFGRSATPLEYDALDQQPVHLLFLIVGQDNLVSLHIKLLSRISRMMTKDDFREKLMNAATKEEILAIFKEEESSYFDL
ncbi:MAG: PTS sugar transporter subunit IIA [Ignavibacteriales bacterium]|nr:PTS sugar transporter subunit IIA [Ignavibacteriales bacterium]